MKFVISLPDCDINALIGIIYIEFCCNIGKQIELLKSSFQLIKQLVRFSDNAYRQTTKVQQVHHKLLYLHFYRSDSPVNSPDEFVLKRNMKPSKTYLVDK